MCDKSMLPRLLSAVESTLINPKVFSFACQFQHSTRSFNMKTTAVLCALLTTAFAIPTNHPGDNDQHKKKPGKHYGRKGPFVFTSTYNVVATPDQVVDANNTLTGGLAGAKGWFNYGINSHENVICFNITLENFRGEYASPATTATHIHQAPKGKAGPPR